MMRTIVVAKKWRFSQLLKVRKLLDFFCFFPYFCRVVNQCSHFCRFNLLTTID